MTFDMFRLSYSQPGPFLIHNLSLRDRLEGLSSNRFKPKTNKLAVVASPLSTQH